MKNKINKIIKNSSDKIAQDTMVHCSRQTDILDMITTLKNLFIFPALSRSMCFLKDFSVFKNLEVLFVTVNHLEFPNNHSNIQQGYEPESLVVQYSD